MNTSVHKTRRALVVLGACAALAGPALSQSPAWPQRTIKILVGTSAGASTDGVARLYGQKLSELLGVPVIIENKPGAANLLAIRSLLQAAPDGYTLYAAVGSNLAQAPAVRKDLPYDPLKDFTLIGFFGTAPGTIYVNAELPVKTMPELVAYARANPGKLSFGSGGFGSAGHLQGEYLMSRTGIKLLHVPFKSDPDAAREVGAGRLQVGFSTTRAVVPLVTDGKVRPLATTDWKRAPQLPNVPAIAESGVSGLEGMAPYSFFGLVGPANLPPAVVSRLGEAINRITVMPDVAAQMRDTLLIEPVVATPAEFRQFIDKEMVKWREIGKTLAMKE